MRGGRAALLSGLLACAAFGADGAEAKKPDVSPDRIVQHAQQLRAAIVNRDMKFLIRKSRDISGLALIETHFEFNDFAFSDQEVRRNFGPRAKSLRTLLSRQPVGIIYEGPISFSNDSNDQTYIIYFFVADKKFSERRVASIVSKRWMVDYAACKIQLHGADWFLKDSFCFDETDGPWPIR